LAHAAGLPKRGIQTKRARLALIAANFTATQSARARPAVRVAR
jgi:hypothetical protein